MDDDFRASQWAQIGLDADRVRDALLTLLWVARGQLTAAGTDEVASAARAVVDVAEGGLEDLRQVRNFLTLGHARVEEREHVEAMAARAGAGKGAGS